MRKSFTLCLLALVFLLTAACGARQVRSTRAHVPPKAEPALAVPAAAPAAAAEMKLIAVPNDPEPVAEALTGREAHVEERIKEADRDIRNAERILARKSVYRPKAESGKLANAFTADDFKVDRSGFDRLHREFTSWFEGFLAQLRGLERRGPAQEPAETSETEMLAAVEVTGTDESATDEDEDGAMLGMTAAAPPIASAPVLPTVDTGSVIDRFAHAYLPAIAVAFIAGIALGILLSRRKSPWIEPMPKRSREEESPPGMLVTELHEGRPMRTFRVRSGPPPIPLEPAVVSETMEAEWYDSFEAAVRAEDPVHAPEPETLLTPDIISGVTETTQRPPPQDDERTYPKVIYEA